MVEQLELIRSYLDKNTNILREPNKAQIQMVEGIVFSKKQLNSLKIYHLWKNYNGMKN